MPSATVKVRSHLRRTAHRVCLLQKNSPQSRPTEFAMDPDNCNVAVSLPELNLLARATIGQRRAVNSTRSVASLIQSPIAPDFNSIAVTC